MKTTIQLWVRLGDTSEYSAYDDVEGAAAALNEAGVQYPLFRVFGGVTAQGFRGENHISLYWGDEKANRIRDLTDDELKAVEKELG